MKKKNPKISTKLGRPPKLPPTAKCALVRFAAKDHFSACYVHEDTAIDVSVRTVRSVLNEIEKMSWEHLKSGPKLEQRYEKARLNWSKQFSV